MSGPDAPPALLVNCNALAAKLEDATRAPGLIEARNILYHPAAALAEIMFLFVRIHGRRPFDVDSEA